METMCSLTFLVALYQQAAISSGLGCNSSWPFARSIPIQFPALGHSNRKSNLMSNSNNNADTNYNKETSPEPTEHQAKT